MTMGGTTTLLLFVAMFPEVAESSQMSRGRRRRETSDAVAFRRNTGVQAVLEWSLCEVTSDAEELFRFKAEENEPRDATLHLSRSAEKMSESPAGRSGVKC